VGSWELGSKNYSCSGWEQLEAMKAAYAANNCALPYSFNGWVEATPQYSNSLTGYFGWKENAIRTNNRIEGVGSTAP
jgi:hypothetical protein